MTCPAACSSDSADLGLALDRNWRTKLESSLSLVWPLVAKKGKELSLNHRLQGIPGYGRRNWANSPCQACNATEFCSFSLKL